MNPIITSPIHGTIYTISEGDQLTISCKALGIPAAYLLFSRNSPDLNDATSRFTPSNLYSEMYNGSARHLLSSTRNFTLMAAVDEDSGNYTCIANSTTPETAEVTFEIIVQGMITIYWHGQQGTFVIMTNPLFMLYSFTQHFGIKTTKRHHCCQSRQCHIHMSGHRQATTTHRLDVGR